MFHLAQIVLLNHFEIRSGNIYPLAPVEPVSAQDFDSWKNTINSLCLETFKKECDDLPDLPYNVCFQEEITPYQMIYRLQTILS
jgi:hypothetical protein